MKTMPAVSLLLLSLFLLRAADARCQQGNEPPNPFSLAIRGHYGFIIPHSEKIEAISDSYPWGIEADLAWHLVRERIWKHCYCYPRTGFSLNYFNFADPGVLGHSIVLYPYIEPWIRPQKRFSISFRFGIGPAVVTRTYDAETNPDNLFFSTHLSFIAMLNTGLNFRLSDRLSTRVAFNYNHISNGGITRPNLGMNFPAMNAGLEYSITEVSFPCRAKDTLKVLYPEKGWWDAYILGTMKDDEIDRDQHYPVIGAGIYYNRLVLRMLALNAGTEWVSDFSLKEKIRREYINDPGSAPDHNRAALLAGFDLVFGRFSFVHQWGLYYYAPYPAIQKFYQRYGLSFRFTESLYLGINIKAHGHVADLMDLRLGVRF